MTSRQDFDVLLEEAERRPFVGWDVSYDQRIRITPPWDFGAIVDAHTRLSPDLLDLGTGGGEWLNERPHLPTRTVATEGWSPNVPVARARLEPRGIDVIAVHGAPDNIDQEDFSPECILPFPADDFHLVISRHESYVPSEVLRVLAPGGIFLTQQVASSGADDFYRLFDAPAPSVPVAWDLTFAVRQLERAGFTVTEKAEGFETIEFADVGALAWYLKNLPFVYPDFSIAAARQKLHRLHADDRRAGSLTIRQPLFWLKAVAPGATGPRRP